MGINLAKKLKKGDVKVDGVDVRTNQTGTGLCDSDSAY